MTKDRLQIYRLAFMAKLFELSGEIFKVELIRESYAVDYQYRCYSSDGFNRCTNCYVDFDNPELTIEDITRDARMIWSGVQFDRSQHVS